RAARHVPGARLALCGGTAARRGHASSDDPVGRALWRDAAQCQWCADPPGGAVEIWFQGHQGDHQDQPCRQTAADELEPDGATGIWLLCKCKPASGSSALEPGDRAAHRRGWFLRLRTAGYTDVQRLWRTGRLALCRHGPEGKLLMLDRARPSPARAVRKPEWWNRVPVWLVYVAGLAPAAWGFYLGATGGLGADPVKAFEHLLGLWTLRFLILTLLVTPIRDLTGVSLMRYRRALGLLACYYGLMHFSSYMILDQALNFSAILTDIARRPFITIGMAALVLMVPLAMTSNRWSIRKLGANWNRLHKLIYVIAAAGALHFFMSVKGVPAEPVIY